MNFSRLKYRLLLTTLLGTASLSAAFAQGGTQTGQTVLGSGIENCSSIPANGGGVPLLNADIEFHVAGDAVVELDDNGQPVFWVSQGQCDQPAMLGFASIDRIANYPVEDVIVDGPMAVDPNDARPDVDFYTTVHSAELGGRHVGLNQIAVNNDVLIASSSTGEFYLFWRPPSSSQTNNQYNDLIIASNQNSYVYGSFNSGLYRKEATSNNPTAEDAIITSFSDNIAGALAYDEQADVIYVVKDETSVFAVDNASAPSRNNVGNPVFQFDLSTQNTRRILAMATDGEYMYMSTQYESPSIRFGIVAYHLQSEALTVIYEEDGANSQARCNSLQVVGDKIYAANYAGMVREFDVLSAGGPLAVEDLTLSAEQSEDGMELLFSTSSETNNDYFDIQHSTDGRTWSVIGQIEGQGTTNQPTEYAFLHENPANGQNYYRIKPVAYDGTPSYSNVVWAQYNGPKNTIIFHPNPVDKETFHYSSEQDISLVFALNASTGQKLTLAANGNNIQRHPNMIGVWFLAADVNGNGVLDPDEAQDLQPVVFLGPGR